MLQDYANVNQIDKEQGKREMRVYQISRFKSVIYMHIYDAFEVDVRGILFIKQTRFKNNKGAST